MASRTPLHKNLMRIVPLAFLAGAGVELFMIYVRVGNETFYDTAKRLESQRREQRRKDEEELEQRVRLRSPNERQETKVQKTAAELQ